LLYLLYLLSYNLGFDEWTAGSAAAGGIIGGLIFNVPGLIIGGAIGINTYR